MVQKIKIENYLADVVKPHIDKYIEHVTVAAGFFSADKPVISDGALADYLNNQNVKPFKTKQWDKAAVYRAKIKLGI